MLDAGMFQAGIPAEECGMWNMYRRIGMLEARPYVPGEDLTNVSVSDTNIPGEGGMIARNPENHAEQWYIAADYFAKNYQFYGGLAR